MVDAADKLAVLEMAVDDLELFAVTKNKCVLARYAAVVEDDIVLSGPADGVASCRA